jgi:hypothetical protein
VVDRGGLDRLDARRAAEEVRALRHVAGGEDLGDVGALVLRVGDQELEDFDSGLVGGGSEFPAIDIRISINGEQFTQTMIDVRAIRFPANTGR